MGWFNRDKVNSIVPYANSGQLKPRVGAKALKDINSPKVMAKSKAAADSYGRAKAAETSRVKDNDMLGLKDNDEFARKPYGSEAAYLKGGAKGEQKYQKKGYY